MRKLKEQVKNQESIQVSGKLEEIIIQALLEKNGQEIILINLKEVNHVLFDYFIICTGTSKPHIETLTDFVIESTKKNAKIRPTYVEGQNNGEWILLDYFNIIVHLFQPEARDFYDIEKLWNDADIQHF
ncbi:ribosome silencing factor [Bacteroidales bacterium OttesenSCG-928-B11]|nr:ribosome silencing factor [Bacteroidales bacterium OttesenSCG-928-E04]MDL2308804.1 ribosome silencing factor [Bacteroidales bacterium OttesenSCG-928-C03]MDL2312082.1 ribosome silencing factor [Bacteroidales bacterium OttesenSCG-928-B11]MDL2325692.1 ribosome silencing factor [Bacteroidales bacterium OttesenSCG-928-A14]